MDECAQLNWYRIQFQLLRKPCIFFGHCLVFFRFRCTQITQTQDTRKEEITIKILTTSSVNHVIYDIRFGVFIIVKLKTNEEKQHSLYTWIQAVLHMLNNIQLLLYNVFNMFSKSNIASSLPFFNLMTYTNLHILQIPLNYVSWQYIYSTL